MFMSFPFQLGNGWDFIIFEFVIVHLKIEFIFYVKSWHNMIL